MDLHCLGENFSETLKKGEWGRQFLMQLKFCLFLKFIKIVVLSERLE